MRAGQPLPWAARAHRVRRPAPCGCAAPALAGLPRRGRVLLLAALYAMCECAAALPADGPQGARRNMGASSPSSSPAPSCCRPRPPRSFRCRGR